MRLDKFISSQTGNSRSDVKTAVRKGLVSVNGVAVKSADAQIDPQTDKVKFSGNDIIYKEFLYIMLNKPQGVICATKDRLSETVMALLPENLRRQGLFPAGRLDKDTEGFVFITDDGQLAHKILSPKNHIPKTYYCELERDFEEYYIKEFKDGITFRTGEKCRPAELIKGENPKTCEVIICEGMFHQVKKMFEVVGNRVVFLKRIRMGNLDLDPNLALGEGREIMHKELLLLTDNFE